MFRVARQALKLWLDDVVESCSDTVGMLFEAELASACCPAEAGPSSLSGLEDDWHSRGWQGEHPGAGRSGGGAHRRERAFGQDNSKARLRRGEPARCAPAPASADRALSLDELAGLSQLDWQASAPKRAEAPGPKQPVWSLDELAEEWYDTSRAVKDRELSKAEACLAGAASR